MADGTRLERISKNISPPICDVVFVHGLSGDGHTTWQNKNNSAGNSWLEWTAEAIPEAAIWTVTYDAAALAWLGSAMPIPERAKNILALLEARDIGSRPIAFVTHSMGGLIVKKMMQIAESHGIEEFSPFADFTKLIVFVSVPHQGSSIASYLDALRVVFRPSAASNDLQANEPALFELNEWFRNFVKNRGLRIASFHEEEKTKGVIVVPRTSADFGYPGHTSIGESLNHIDIVKPRDKSGVIFERTNKFLSRFVIGCKKTGVNASGAISDVDSESTYALKYLKTTVIDLKCATELMKLHSPPKIEYSAEIAEAVKKLNDRDVNPAEFMRQNPYMLGLENVADREKRATDQYAYNSDLLRRVNKVSKANESALGKLVAWLSTAQNSDGELSKSLETFGALASLKMIMALKSGFDWIDGHPQMWFEHFKFNSDHSYCILDWVPRPSQTGRVVFGSRYWVGARVGNERYYEYVMFPLRYALPLFRNEVEGDRDAFYSWVLPQLVSYSYHPFDEFPIADWELFLLQGAHGREWWSPNQDCPWPETVNNIDMLEL